MTSSLANLKLPPRYRALQLIANGGMGSVWCAEDELLGRLVALKLLSERFAHDPAAVRRVKREARAAAHLSGHPHIVGIYDVCEQLSNDDELSRPIIVMEYLGGGTVASAVRDGAVERRQSLKWISEAASALDYAHSRGVLHRDIKLANLLLDQDRILHVADFGIAQISSEDTITSTGLVVGTAAYLAPERALGGVATEPSDRYSLAVAAFELLVGDRPFTARHAAAQARQHVEEPPPRASERNPELPPSVDSILARALAKQPEERWPTARAFAEALDGALSDRPPPATRRPGTGPPPVIYRQRRRSRRAIALGALTAALAAIAAVAVISLQANQRQPHPSGAARLTAKRPAPARSSSARRAKRTRTNSTTTTSTVVAPYTPTATSTSAATSTASAPSPSPSPPAGSPAGEPVTSSPAATQLEAEGHQLMLDGNYPAAIGVLQRALNAAPSGSLTYAYALYDLGRSLRLGGQPEAAVAVLRRRMQIPNQTDVVNAELQLAVRAAGASKPASKSAQPPVGPKENGAHRPGHHSAPSSITTSRPAGQG